MKTQANFNTGLNLLNDFTYDGTKGSFIAEKLISPTSNGITILQSGIFRVMIVATVKNAEARKRYDRDIIHLLNEKVTCRACNFGWNTKLIFPVTS